jgi:hypothetical protein
MSRTCTSCQHLKRAEIDRRLAAGEPTAQVARDYQINLSSLHRHRVNCLRLGSANDIKKEAARGSAAVALLPSKETLSENYRALCARIDRIVDQAQREGSLAVAVSGLNSIRQTLDSQARLADRSGRRHAVEDHEFPSGIGDLGDHQIGRDEMIIRSQQVFGPIRVQLGLATEALKGCWYQSNTGQVIAFAVRRCAGWSPHWMAGSRAGSAI